MNSIRRFGPLERGFCLVVGRHELLDLLQAAVVRLLIGGQNMEGGDFSAGPLDLSVRGLTDAVSVERRHNHHPGFITLQDHADLTAHRLHI